MGSAPKPNVPENPGSSTALPRGELWVIAGSLLAGLFVFVLLERALLGGWGGDPSREVEDSQRLTAKGMAFVLAAGAVLFGVLRGTRAGDRLSRPRSHTEAERFEWVARASTDAMWDWDLARNRVWRSAGYYTLLGCRPPELPGTIEAWIDRLHPDDQERVVTGWREALRSGRTRWTDSYRLRAQSGAYVALVDRACLLRNEQGDPVRAIGGLTAASAARGQAVSGSSLTDLGIELGEAGRGLFPPLGQR